MTTERRCLVRYQPQAWINDHAVDIDGKCDIDVTERILEMGREKALQLKDYSDDGDLLVEGLYEHQGPFNVELEEQIQKFFEEVE